MFWSNNFWEFGPRTFVSSVCTQRLMIGNIGVVGAVVDVVGNEYMYNFKNDRRIEKVGGVWKENEELKDYMEFTMVVVGGCKAQTKNF